MKKEDCMKQWDGWRSLIADGFKGSRPRDAFENMLECFYEDINNLRKLLWLTHCDHIKYLYGNDGEMQCNKCRIDFKRDSIDKIKAKLFSTTGGTR